MIAIRTHALNLEVGKGSNTRPKGKRSLLHDVEYSKDTVTSSTV